VNRPCDLAVDGEGILHIVGGGAVEICTRAGQKLGAWGEKGLDPDRFKCGPHGCWIDGEDSRPAERTRRSRQRFAAPGSPGVPSVSSTSPNGRAG
jgi:hypothetical protein